MNKTKKKWFYASSIIFVNNTIKFKTQNQKRQKYLKKILSVKGLVHPKMKILSVFTHPHVVTTP